MINQKCFRCGIALPHGCTSCFNCGIQFYATADDSQAEAQTPQSVPPQSPAEPSLTDRYAGRTKLSRCSVCQTGIPAYRTLCFECERPAKVKSVKSNISFMFVGIVIASLAVLSIVYFYAMDSGHSPESVRKKFETATGIDKSLVYNNYRLRGTSTILATNRSVRKPVINKDLYFEMIFNKPNKFYIDHYEAAKNEPYTSPRKSVVKEGSNGSSGWSYSNFDIAKPETTQTQNPGEVGHEIYLGLSDFVSARIIEDDICKQVDDVTLNMIQPPISYKVDGEQKMAGYCKTVKLQVLEVGEKDKSTLEFAADTGLLLSSFSSEDQNPLKGSTRLVYSEYKEFRIKKKSFWGAVTEKPILMPSKMIVTYESGEVTVRITIKIDSLETDVLIDTSTFEMPM